MTNSLLLNRTIQHLRPQRPQAAAARRLMGQIAGHLWTVAPALLAWLRPPAGSKSRAFETAVADPAWGPVRLTGLLSEVEGADTIVLIVHGLSGNALSPYCASAAQAAAQAGFASLRLSLRGADFSGEDILHGGMTQDLWAALRAPEIARYKHVLLLGYSVGGHIALRAAVEQLDPRLRAVAAICPPLDLHHATRAFDHPARRPYRLHIFRGLNRAYTAAARRGRAPIPPAVVARARSCRERDSLTVVVRFGFRSAEDYYERESVAPRLHRLRIPSLVVQSRHDPLVPPETVIPAIAGASRALSTIWVEPGGHVYFPKRLDLGLASPLGLENQVIGWLGEHI
jgi:predicted alpha/beta-fold hydrolase